jgi:hypothetical protein
MSKDWEEVKYELLTDEERRKAYQKVDLGFEIAKMVTDARILKQLTAEHSTYRKG